MKRLVMATAVLGGLFLGTLLLGSGQEQPKEKFSIREVLNRKAKFPPLEDPKITLADEIATLEKRFGLTIRVNEGAFRFDGVMDITKTEIVGMGGMLKEMNVPLATYLSTLLERLSTVPSGARYTIQPDGITITTGARLMDELGRLDDEPIGTLIYRDWEKTTLKDAIAQINEDCDTNIVIDPRAGDKASSAVITARLHNVTVRTAVQLLAEMADLDVTKIENVYFISDTDRIAKVNREEERMFGTLKKKAPGGQ